MGCCFSTPETPNHPYLQNGPENQQSQLRSPVQKLNVTHAVDDRAPPPVEEETVKEVLSETPISKPQVSILVEERKTQMPVLKPQPEKFAAEGVIEKAEEVYEVSQLSEICSMSESFSTATNTTATTTTITEKREDEATSKQSSREGSQTHRLNRPLSNAPRKRPYTLDSTSGRERRAKSPARRPEPSPDKVVQGSTRSVRGRQSGHVATRKLNVGSAGIRRDPGEGSGRRSRSPSTRSVSGVSKVNAGGRSQLKPSGEAGRPPQAGGEENSGPEKVEEKSDSVPQDSPESLENPHVSLECFIFL